MPSGVVSNAQFVARPVTEQAPSNIPASGSEANWGAKRFTAWSTNRGKSTIPAPGSRMTLGTTMDLSE